MVNYRFYKTGSSWYIDLPAYIDQGGSIDDLQMVDGADTMLDILAEGCDEVSLSISSETFADANLVELIEKCDPFIGGGNYVLRNYNGQTINQQMWLCQVTEFVFGDIPERIYVKKI